jgi:hypothetical protein
MDGNELTRATQKTCEILAQWKDHEETSEAVTMAPDLVRQNPTHHVATIRTIGEG